MRTIVDLHMHSHYSRATSKALTIEGIARFAQIKGVDVIATGDITHPKWLEEMEEKLIDDGSGLYQLRDGSSPTRFVLFGEIASMYKKDGVGRRLHTLFGVSTLAAARKVNDVLKNKGFNLAYDGRPIVGMDVRELMKIYLDADPQAIIIPAHIWTPWFAVFGSKSGFDSLEACFEEMLPYVYAIETGLSSDPAMNWRIPDLNNRMILSNSDAHSAEKIGREANVFDLPERSWKALYTAITQNKHLDYTIEFYPEEGKYHMDGHRACDVRLTPVETAKYKGLCPKCGLPLVVGVMNRVEQLARQAADGAGRPGYKSIVPLPEIISDALGVGQKSKAVKAEFDRLIAGVGNEFHILLDASQSEIAAVAQPIVAEAIQRVREGRLHIDPGYDGVFGTIKVFTEAERKKYQPKQSALF